MGESTINLSSVTESISKIRIVPLIALDTVEDGLKVGEILAAGGLKVLEVTFRTEAAEATIRETAKAFPEMLIGAGTVLNPEDAERALDAGAKFAVSPGFNPKVVKHAQKIGLPFFPGICNPTDVEAALELGLKTLKFFPAAAAGGSKMLKAMAAPYKHLGISYIPTGGISTANMKEYLAIPEVLAIGGTWIAKKEMIVGKQWQKIADNVKEAIDIANS